MVAEAACFAKEALNAGPLLHDIHIPSALGRQLRSVRDN
jgi:hypothetical protein